MKSLEGLTQKELSNLRAALQIRGKDARKLAIKAITSQQGPLKEAWSKYISTPPKDVPESYAGNLRAAFEAELAKHPDAFIKQLVANLHIEMDQSIMGLMMERSKVRK